MASVIPVPRNNTPVPAKARTTSVWVVEELMGELSKAKSTNMLIKKELERAQEQTAVIKADTRRNGRTRCSYGGRTHQQGFITTSPTRSLSRRRDQSKYSRDKESWEARERDRRESRQIINCLLKESRGDDGSRSRSPVWGHNYRNQRNNNCTPTPSNRLYERDRSRDKYMSTSSRDWQKRHEPPLTSRTLNALTPRCSSSRPPANTCWETASEEHFARQRLDNWFSFAPLDTYNHLSPPVLPIGKTWSQVGE